MSDAHVIRIGQEMVKDLTIIVRCKRTFKWRFRIAMALMRLAGRIGGFKAIRVVRDSRSSER